MHVEVTCLQVVQEVEEVQQQEQQEEPHQVIQLDLVIPKYQGLSQQILPEHQGEVDL